MSREIALEVPCHDNTLVGVLHRGRDDASVGVVVVVGGPQYRVGSHRQFVLLARALAYAGIPVLRFDYRGMGDSPGEPRQFGDLDEDIKAAINTLCENVTTLKKIVIWGLCDAASAALFYAHKDPRVSGLVLLNPWVRTDAGMARAYLKHYYLQRLFSVEFWKKVLSGQWGVRASLRSFTGFVEKLRGRSNMQMTGSIAPAAIPQLPLPDRMALAWEQFSGGVLLILSGNNDYVADEFRDVAQSSHRWRRLLLGRSTTRKDFPEANHTFSRRAWRDQVAQWTCLWIAENFSD